MKKLNVIFFLIVLCSLLSGCYNNEFIQNNIKTWITVDHNSDLIFTKLGELYDDDYINKKQKDEFITLGNKVYKNLEEAKDLLQKYGWDYEVDNTGDIALRQSVITKMKELVFNYRQLEQKFLLIYITSTEELIDLPEIFIFEEILQ
ncbi:MAG: hypothetical protein ACOC2W_00755 [bacterium]